MLILHPFINISLIINDNKFNDNKYSHTSIDKYDRKLFRLQFIILFGKTVRKNMYTLEVQIGVQKFRASKKSQVRFGLQSASQYFPGHFFFVQTVSEVQAFLDLTDLWTTIQWPISQHMFLSLCPSVTVR